MNQDCNRFTMVETFFSLTDKYRYLVYCT